MKAIEDQIRRAIEEGKFDHLSGKGKPLQLDQNPHEDPEWSAAFRILRNSGYTLPWIETRQELEQALLEARSRLARTCRWHAEAQAGGYSPQEIQDEWQRAVDEFQRQIAEINLNIRSYNMHVPLSTFQIALLDPEVEIQRIIRDENLATR